MRCRDCKNFQPNDDMPNIESVFSVDGDDGCGQIESSVMMVYEGSCTLGGHVDSSTECLFEEEFKQDEGFSSCMVG